MQEAAYSLLDYNLQRVSLKYTVKKVCDFSAQPGCQKPLSLAGNN
jgi:hypothetical protein